jgi:hypothetical protein
VTIAAGYAGTTKTANLTVTADLMSFPTTDILDNFNRDNESPPPSSSWTNIMNGLMVVSNVCGGYASGTYNVSRWNTQYGPDVEVYATIANVENYLEIFARADSDYSNGYGLSVAGSSTLRVYKYTGGTPDQVGGDISLGSSIAAGDSIGLEIIGSGTGNIKVYFKEGSGSWTLKGTLTDGDFTDAGYIGAWVYSSLQAIDDFGGGTATPAPPLQ